MPATTISSTCSSGAPMQMWSSCSRSASPRTSSTTKLPVPVFTWRPRVLRLGVREVHRPGAVRYVTRPTAPADARRRRRADQKARAARSATCASQTGETRPPPSPHSRTRSGAATTWPRFRDARAGLARRRVARGVGEAFRSAARRCSCARRRATRWTCTSIQAPIRGGYLLRQPELSRRIKLQALLLAHGAGSADGSADAGAGDPARSGTAWRRCRSARRTS